MIDRSFKTFQFRQFALIWNSETFPLTTDSLILGSWAPMRRAEKRVLDVGTGSGVLALMSAQRCRKARIEAVDVSAAAIGCATYNFRSSPWSDRLTAHVTSLRNWSERGGVYDLIISNPPYYTNSLQSPSDQKARTRHRENDHWGHFFGLLGGLLHPDGGISLILPYSEREEVLKAAIFRELFPTGMLHIRPRTGEQVTRLACHFSREDRDPVIEELTLMIEEGCAYSAAFQKLTKAFYLPSAHDSALKKAAK